LIVGSYPVSGTYLAVAEGTPLHCTVPPAEQGTNSTLKPKAIDAKLMPALILPLTTLYTT